MRRLVRVFWGPRPEPVEAVAARWRATLGGFDALLDAPGPGRERSWQQIRPSGPPTDLTGDRDSLRGVLVAARADADWSDVIGDALRVAATGAPGWDVEISGLAGGAPEYLLQSLVATIAAPDDAAVPEAELLAMLVRVWEPDFGDVTDDDILDALEDDADLAVGDPCIGRHAYLSPGRAGRLPEDLGATVRRFGGGALVAVEGDVDEVVRVYRRIREAGALEPLPRPMDRATL
ncbi:hypothetical protein [Rhodococcus kronopolitis]|uniref:Uncharacterized protein n=1 Tax=Rhodococcus kronopolitis TaxID=1460226 RepID=A0ABV9FTL9_9NOCA